MERYKNLALTLRPQQFKSFLSNEHIVSILKNILSTGKIPAGILLSGTRGIGKTTLARLFARSLNCTGRKKNAEPCNKCESCVMSYSLSHPDIIEISGSNNGNIEDVRSIIDQAMLSPMVGNYRVFIIDEAHGLGRSSASWDALLKVLEEPPPHIVWVFCTTQKHKIPDTIKSRLLSLDLRVVPTSVLENYLTEMLAAIKGEEAAPIIARAANNSVRDALTLTEKVVMYCNQPGVGFNRDAIYLAVGTFDESQTLNILEYLTNKDPIGLWKCLDDLIESGIDIEAIFNKGLVKIISNLMCVALGAQVDSSSLYMSSLQSIGFQRLLFMSDIISKRTKQFLEAHNKKFVLQLITLELCA